MVTGIKDWSTTPGNNNSPSPNGAPEGMAPSAVNDVIRQNMSEVREWYEDADWIDLGLTPTYVDDDTIRLSGDQTAVFHTGRRVRATGTTPFTVYGTISSSSYSSPNTDVNVTWDTGSLDNTLATLAMGPEASNKPISATGVKFNSGDVPASSITNPALTKTADYTALTSDIGKTILIDATAGDVTITADATLGSGFNLTFVRIDNSENTVTFDPTSSVNGAETKVVTGQYSRLGVVSNGSDWFITDDVTMIASAAETLTGTEENKAISPAGFAGNKDLTTEGYYKLPGGLIMQWGVETDLDGVGGTAAVTFPEAFPEAAVSVMVGTSYASAIGSDSNTIIVLDKGTVTTSGFSAFVDNVSGGASFPCDMYWFAIGY